MESPQPLRSRAIAALRRARRARAVLGLAAGALLYALPAGASDTLTYTASAPYAAIAPLVDAQIGLGQLPGAVIIVGDAHRVLYRAAFGLREIEPVREAMTLDTEFDLASLTKVIATTTAVLQLVEQGQLQLDAPAARYWPAFAAAGKADVTLRQLLAHTSGLPPDLRLAPDEAGRDRVLRDAAAAQLIAEPGQRVIYSDVNFIVLGHIVERVTGQPLDRYCDTHIFAPLGMRDTMFTPDAEHAARSAATTPDSHGMRRGTVHDPFAARMGGVAGHAGLFSSGDDLVRFAQMLLGGTPARVLSPASVALLATPQSPLAQTPWRGIGWELAPPLSADRDRLPPAGAIGHTGYTGTGLWIDFVTGRFALILTNRVHPDDTGDARPLRAQVLSLLASQSPALGSAALARSVPSLAPALAEVARPPRAVGPVGTGIDVLEDEGFAPLAGRRVGLITNRSGFDAQGRRTIDVLRNAPGVTLVALYAPEHGIASDADAPVADSVDTVSGLPVHSLYGATHRFPAGALDGLDALVFDLQDAGVRLFTYETTLGYALEAAAARHVPLYVLDRPDPLGADRFGGPVLDPERISFTGYFPLPLQPGMTVGELATLFNRERGIGADLHVIPMRGYRRAMRFGETGLGWVPISPNLRSLAALEHYPDLVLLEGANVSVGRGTPDPFRVIGAPWIDGEQLARALNRAGAGARFEAVDFVPTEAVWHGTLCHGVRIVESDPERAPGQLGLTMLATLHALYPDRFDLEAASAAVGSAAVAAALADGADGVRAALSNQAALQRFAALRAQYLLYP